VLWVAVGSGKIAKYTPSDHGMVHQWVADSPAWLMAVSQAASIAWRSSRFLSAQAGSGKRD
jgi:hypothetical protein